MVEDSSSNDGGSQDLGLAGVNLKCGASVVNRAGPDSLGEGNRPVVANWVICVQAKRQSNP